MCWIDQNRERPVAFDFEVPDRNFELFVDADACERLYGGLEMVFELELWAQPGTRVGSRSP